MWTGYKQNADRMQTKCAGKSYVPRSMLRIQCKRIGLSNNTTLQNVYLYDGATRITDSSSVRTDGSITFNSASGLFAVHFVYNRAHIAAKFKSIFKTRYKDQMSRGPIQTLINH